MLCEHGWATERGTAWNASPDATSGHWPFHTKSKTVVTYQLMFKRLYKMLQTRIRLRIMNTNECVLIYVGCDHVHVCLCNYVFGQGLNT